MTDKSHIREELRRTNAGRRRSDSPLGVEIVKGPPPSDYPRGARSYRPSGESSVAKKWTAIATSVITVLGGLTYAIADLVERLGSFASKTEVAAIASSAAKCQSDLYKLQNFDNQLLKSEEAFRIRVGVDRRENIEGAILYDIENPSGIRLRSENICEPKDLECRVHWGFTGMGIPPLPPKWSNVPTD